jgi:hypothetical protein
MGSATTSRTTGSTTSKTDNRATVPLDLQTSWLPTQRHMDGHGGPMPWSLQLECQLPTTARLGEGLGRLEPTLISQQAGQNLNNPDSDIRLPVDLQGPAAIG